MRVDRNRCLVPIVANISRKNLCFPHFVGISLDACQDFGPIGTALVGIYDIEDITAFDCGRSKLHLVNHSSIHRLLGASQVIDSEMQGEFIVLLIFTEKMIHVMKHRYISTTSFHHTVNIDLLGLLQQQGTQQLRNCPISTENRSLVCEGSEWEFEMMQQKPG